MPVAGTESSVKEQMNVIRDKRDDTSVAVQWPLSTAKKGGDTYNEVLRLAREELGQDDLRTMTSVSESGEFVYFYRPDTTLPDMSRFY